MLAGMKKTLATFSAALLLTLSGCGPTPEEAARGTYHLDVEALLKRFDDSVPKPNSLSMAMRKDVARSAGYIVLEAEGKLVMNQGGDEINDAEGTWSIEGEKLSLKLGGAKQAATLKDGVITMVVNPQPTGTRTFVLGDPVEKKKDATEEPKADPEGGKKEQK